MLDVLSFVNAEKAKIKQHVELLTKQIRQPRMAIITDSQNFGANQSYIKSKTSFAMDVGVACDVIVLSKEDEFPDISDYDGVIIQYPFFDYSFNTFRLLVSATIPPNKDIDGLGNDAVYKPCTPLGIIMYIDHLRKMEILKQDIVVDIIGCGGLVGKPLAELLLRDPRCTVCVTRSSTNEWVSDNFMASADVIVCATPTPNLIKWTSKSKVYIDCGTALVDGKLLGNVHRDCYGEDELITPVPNGVGRLTVLSLFKNLLAAYYQNGSCGTHATM